MKVLLLCALLAIPAGSVLVAQWTTDPTANTAFALGKDKRYDLTAISDASGNVYSAWYDVSTGTTGGVYVQKTSPSGSLPWGAAGVRVDSIPESFQSPTLALDGSGGVFVSWVDSRSANSTQNIYAQHLSAGGVPQWQTSGANITNLGEFSFRSPINPQSLGDGSGNYFLSWEDAFGLTLMKVSSSGSVAWTTPVDDTLGAVDSRITSDGSGGIILSWTDDRGLSTDIANIYAQKVNSGGTAVWAHNGILVCGATNLQEYSQIVGDGSGGAIIAWQDFRDASHFRGYAQRINSNGVPQWTADGVPISTTTNSINGLVMTTDGAGGAEFAWEEARGTGIGGSDNIYGQRLNSSGQRQWSDSGANVCVNTAPQENPAITSDGNGGATIVWSDNRSSGANENIYGQRVNAAGSVAWTADGILISGASGNQERPLVVSMPSNSAVA
ncbi:MAG TPA: hypothetical protein VMG34_08880, partial [Bacteroidota bacterium]|nr:hypothetical protein [Bacteroidota bacterium]